MNAELAVTIDRMKRPEALTDEYWEAFKYELSARLSARNATLADYEAFLEATDSTLAEEYEVGRHFGMSDLFISFGNYQRQAPYRAERLALAKDLARDLLVDYFNPFEAELHAHELTGILLDHDEGNPDMFLKTSPKEDLDTRDYTKGVFLWQLDFFGNPIAGPNDEYENPNLNLLKAFVLDKMLEGAAT